MTNAQLEKCRKRLEHFLTDLVEPLGRSERRHWADVYVRGLLLDGERKSIEPLAARVPDGNVQALQQLVGQSPWDWLPVWERLAQRMTASTRSSIVPFCACGARTICSMNQPLRSGTGTT